MNSKSPLAQLLLSYLSLIFVISVFLGLFRTIFVAIYNGDLNPYPIQSIAVNAVLALVPGILFTPILLAGYFGIDRLKKIEPTTVGTVGSIIGVYPAFWLLTTPVGYHEPVSADLASLAKQLIFWGGVLIAISITWRIIFAGKPLRILLGRGAVALGILVAMIGMHGVYSHWSTGTDSPPLGLEATARQTPNVFVILVDTLRADHLSAYGYDLPTSPNVDKFAADATLYTKAIAQAPWTKPSCASLLTSRYPPEIGMKGAYSAVPENVPILPQFLKVENYTTGGVVSSVQISRKFGFDKGFDMLNIGKTKFYWAGLDIPFVKLGFWERIHSYPRYDAQELTEETIAWIDNEREEGRPLFMYLHYSDPHTPYSPPKKEDRWREFATEAGLSVESPPIHPPLEGVTLSPAQVDAMVARYDAEIAYFDKYFGELMRYMEETGFYSESLIILTSDHGEEFLDHDEFGHGNSLYNELLRVPLIVKYPDSMGMPGATTVDRFVALVDIASTIEDVLDARWNVTEWQGRSLLAGADSRSIYADNDAPALRTLYSRSNKLIQHLDLQGQVVGESFFAMDSDFDEKGDGIIPSGIQPIELDAMRAIMVDVFAGAESTLVDLDEETLGELKALGYLD